jgi:hypothetical protein
MIDIKRAVSDGRQVKFSHYHDGSLWYFTEFGETFPVPISDIGNATFEATEKAIFLMRYMRQWNSIGKSEMEQLTDRLYNDPDGLKVSNIAITPGANPESKERMAENINRALDEIESGQAEVVTEFED